VILYYGWGVAALDPPMPVVRYQRRPGEALAPRHQKARAYRGHQPSHHRTLQNGYCRETADGPRR